MEYLHCCWSIFHTWRDWRVRRHQKETYFSEKFAEWHIVSVKVLLPILLDVHETYLQNSPTEDLHMSCDFLLHVKSWCPKRKIPFQTCLPWWNLWILLVFISKKTIHHACFCGDLIKRVLFSGGFKVGISPTKIPWMVHLDVLVCNFHPSPLGPLNGSDLGASQHCCRFWAVISFSKGPFQMMLGTHHDVSPNSSNSTYFVTVDWTYYYSVHPTIYLKCNKWLNKNTH